MRRFGTLTWLAVITGITCFASAKTVQVGPTRSYTTVVAGYTAAAAGDTIEIDPGTYSGNKGWVNISKANLTIRGVPGGARPLLDAGGSALSSKGIFVVASGGTNLTVENLEFANTKIDNTLGDNAAGIRFQSSGLTVRNCYFHDNQDGILTDAGATSDILIEYCEFYHNGESSPANTEGYGLTHNMYIQNVRKFTLQYCYSHDSNVGHVVKTRANTNYILYNLLTTETGTGSRELQLTQGGTCYVIGNVILQGANSENSEIVTYGGEGTNGNPYFYFINNTVINQRSDGAIFISMQNSATTTVVKNNIFQGFGNETLIGGTYSSGITPTNSWITTDAKLANITNHDYHLTSGSTGAINKGAAPGTGYGSVSLTPVYQYIHPCSMVARPTDSTIDIGAYEYTTTTPNQAPTVDAGANQTITLPTSSVSLTGTASDDGQPAPLTYTWSLVSGPASVTFTPSNALSTTASGLTVAGSYILKLTASDSDLSASDTLTITVNPKPNTPPTVDAGANITAYEGQLVYLHATATDADNDPLTYAWSQTAGPAALSPAGATAADYSFTVPALSSRAASTMTFSVTVNDGRGGSASDTVSAQVYLAGDVSHDWTVNVGDLQLLIAAWGTDNSGAWSNWNPNADLNGDNFVNVSDLQIMVINWGKSL